ncbi:MAG TPA: hypothetical protein VLF59_04275 [Candidatus Saccharimonadales bacterium]|nr:hypothetical protein [Candidatus Saccharimonadales bacterium]
MIAIEQTIPWETLQEKIRQTPLMEEHNGEIIRPYLHAEISLREFSYSQVHPTSRYALQQNLATQDRLSGELAQQGYDPLHLLGGLVLRDETGTLTGMIPPIVERTAEGEDILCDGIHRTSNGRWRGRLGFMAIHITGADERYPFYALSNSWDEVILQGTVPTDPALKKNYRDMANYHSLYRDFSKLTGRGLRTAGDNQ